jgi:hypothetical protein
MVVKYENFEDCLMRINKNTPELELHRVIGMCRTYFPNISYMHRLIQTFEEIQMFVNLTQEFWLIVAGALVMLALVSVTPYCMRAIWLYLCDLYNWYILHNASEKRYKSLDRDDPYLEDDTMIKLPQLTTVYAKVGGDLIKVLVDAEGNIVGVPVGGTQVVDSTINEMAMPYSKIYNSNKTPKGMIKFYDLDMHPVGCGVRVSDRVLTVSHVAQIASFAGTSKKSAVKVVNVQHAEALDFAVVELQQGAWAFLGVKSAKIGRPKLNQGVMVFGQKDDCVQKSVGVLMDRTDEPFVVSHNASTLKGWSGGPIYSDNRVVALHVGSRVSDEAVHNRALVLFPFVEHLVEESDDDRSNYIYNQIDYETLRKGKKGKFDRLDFMGVTYVTSGNNYVRMAVDEFETMKQDKGETLWADVEDDDIEPPDFLYTFESDEPSQHFGQASSLDSRLKQQLASSQRVTLSQIMREPSKSSKPIMREAVIRPITQSVMSKEQSKLAPQGVSQTDFQRDVKSTLKELNKSVQSLANSVGQGKELPKPNTPSDLNSQGKDVPSQKSKRRRKRGGVKKL